jgi:hypothetical protein
MSEWWTYSLSDFLLFSPRTYYRLFELYNAAIWPGQILGLAVGVAVAALLWTKRPGQARIALALLAACWIWVACAYHLTRYATINWAAVYLAAAFAAEALLLLGFAVAGRLSPRADAGAGLWIGVGLLAFALGLHPLIGPVGGRAWSQMEIFGVAPDPTVVGTLGAILLISAPLRWALLPVPLAWCAVSGATQATMGSPEAAVMPLAAALAVVGSARRA